MRTHNSIFGNLDSLFLFCTVIEYGSISKASKALGLPTSTLSRRMNSLEKTMGVKLLQTHKRELVPTEKGIELHSACHRYFWQIDQKVGNFQTSTQKVNGVVRLTLPRAFYYDVARKTLRGLQKDYPNIKFLVQKYQQPDIPQSASNTEILMAFTIDNMLNCIAKPLYKTKLGIFAHVDYFKDKPKPEKIEDLQKYPWISNYENQTVPIYKEDVYATTLAIQPRYVVNDIHAVEDEIRAGLGIGLVPVAKARKHKELARIFPEYNFRIRQAYLIYHKTKFFPFVIQETVRRLEIDALAWFNRFNDWASPVPH